MTIVFLVPISGFDREEGLTNQRRELKIYEKCPYRERRELQTLVTSVKKGYALGGHWLEKTIRVKKQPIVQKRPLSGKWGCTSGHTAYGGI